MHRRWIITLSVEKLLKFERPRPSCRRFFVLSGRLQDKFDTHPFLIAGLAVWRVYKKKLMYHIWRRGVIDVWCYIDQDQNMRKTERVQMRELTIEEDRKQAIACATRESELSREPHIHIRAHTHTHTHAHTHTRTHAHTHTHTHTHKPASRVCVYYVRCRCVSAI